MSVISIFGGPYSGSEAVLENLSLATGYCVIRDEDLIRETCERFEMDPARVRNTMYGKPSAFNNFTHERERCIASMKSVLAELLEGDETIFTGFATHLVPQEIPHVLRVLLIAGITHRAASAEARDGLAPKKALAKVRSMDESAYRWTYHLFKTDPWDAALYDIVIPTDRVDPEGALKLVLDNLEKDVVRTGDDSKKAIADFALAAAVELALVRKGHNVLVAADGGDVFLTIDKKVILLARLEEELTRIAAVVPGVTSVTTRIGKNFNQADIYRKFDAELSYRVLLVDDEREYVQTLSERLSMRDVGTHVVHDGETALEFVQDEEPEVMVLDLKMPGIDGVEVLREVKEKHPDMEVIILTGHGGEESRKICMELGAFAYLQKPMDIEKLTGTMKAAYELTRKRNMERRRLTA